MKFYGEKESDNEYVNEFNSHLKDYKYYDEYAVFHEDTNYNLFPNRKKVNKNKNLAKDIDDIIDGH